MPSSVNRHRSDSKKAKKNARKKLGLPIVLGFVMILIIGAGYIGYKSFFKKDKKAATPSAEVVIQQN
ncbi:MAG: hypothetical protein ABL927_14770, partial [Bdellovibrionales bacterium]